MTDFNDTRSMLRKLARAHGAHTAIGRAANNIIELIDNYASHPEWRGGILARIDHQHKHLGRLLSQ